MNGFERAEAQWLEDDREDNQHVGYCKVCGNDIYEGDEVILIDGEYICDDIDCLKQQLDVTEGYADEEDALCSCEHCYCHFEEGDELYRVDDKLVCADIECLMGYGDAQYTDAEGDN